MQPGPQARVGWAQKRGAWAGSPALPLTPSFSRQLPGLHAQPLRPEQWGWTSSIPPTWKPGPGCGLQTPAQERRCPSSLQRPWRRGFWVETRAGGLWWATFPSPTLPLSAAPPAHPQTSHPALSTAAWLPTLGASALLLCSRWGHQVRGRPCDQSTKRSGDSYRCLVAKTLNN